MRTTSRLIRLALPSKSGASVNSSAGFTLLEVVISVTILFTLSVAASTLIQNGIDLRREMGLSHKSAQRTANVLARLSEDFSHVYMVRPDDTSREFLSPKTVFKMRVVSGSSTVSMTAMHHQPVKKNAYESDQSYIYYELREDERYPGRKQLYRGETTVIPTNFDREPELSMRLVGRDLKSMEISCWDGERWIADQWDTTRGTWRNKLPQMIKIDLEAYDVILEEGLELSEAEAEATAVASTVVFLPRSGYLPEVKKRPRNLNWNRM